MWPYYKAWLRRKDKEDQKPRTQILAAMCGHVSEVPIGIGPPLGRKTKTKTKIKYDLVPTAGQLSSAPPEEARIC